MTISPASSADEARRALVDRNLRELRRRIATTGREPAQVRVVAVAKSFGPEMVRAAAAVGLTTIGENYLDELRATRDATTDLDLTWHYLGALQTNKIARIVASADVICSLARVKEAQRLAQLGATQALYVEVDVTGDARRPGAAPHEVAPLVARARELGLMVTGLMTVAPLDGGAREAFRLTRGLADDLGLSECSMGMSDDLEVACEMGSTEVRVGRALFGPRGGTVAPSPNMDPGSGREER